MKSRKSVLGSKIDIFFTLHTRNKHSLSLLKYIHARNASRRRRTHFSCVRVCVFLSRESIAGEEKLLLFKEKLGRGNLRNASSS